MWLNGYGLLHPSEQNRSLRQQLPDARHPGGGPGSPKNRV
jgi:hypothetical protein